MVSIHAPARGATPSGHQRARAPWSFNPRARTGRDDPAQAFGRRQKVSIHAPARGATKSVYAHEPSLVFQSTRPHGARRSGAPWASPHRFQSTRPHGARQLEMDALDLASEFQSTRPHGARLPGHWLGMHLPAVSIHAPARGATLAQAHQQGQGLVSIHAPARGATWSARERPQQWTSFNPRARTGRDTAAGSASRRDEMFQSTRPHGARRIAERRLIYRLEFQSTRPHGARRRPALCVHP